MQTAVAELTAALISDVKASGADRLLFGNLPLGTSPGTYSGPVDMSTSDAEMNARHHAQAQRIARALSDVGLDGATVTSDLQGGDFPIWCHIPDQNEWFQVDGVPCALLPHVIVELQNMAQRGEAVQRLHVTRELAHMATLKD